MNRLPSGSGRLPDFNEDLQPLVGILTDSSDEVTEHDNVHACLDVLDCFLLCIRSSVHIPFLRVVFPSIGEY